MDVSAASGVSPYSFPSVPRNGGQESPAPAAPSEQPPSTSRGVQDAGLLQAQASIYTASTANANGLLTSTDAPSPLAGKSGTAPLVSGIYKASLGTGNASSPVSGLSSSMAGIGGLDATTASSLLSGSGSGGLEGFSSSGTSLNATLALTAYGDPLGSGPATITALAASGASTVDPSQPANAQQAVQAARVSGLGATLNVLA